LIHIFLRENELIFLRKLKHLRKNEVPNLTLTDELFIGNRGSDAIVITGREPRRAVVGSKYANNGNRNHKSYIEV
jgi:hypothetical protein